MTSGDRALAGGRALGAADRAAGQAVAVDGVAGAGAQCLAVASPVPALSGAYPGGQRRRASVTLALHRTPAPLAARGEHSIKSVSGWSGGKPLCHDRQNARWPNRQRQDRSPGNAERPLLRSPRCPVEPASTPQVACPPPGIHRTRTLTPTQPSPTRFAEFRLPLPQCWQDFLCEELVGAQAALDRQPSRG